MTNITIAGGGFAGVWSALAAAATRHRNAANGIEITLVSQDPDLCIRPRLYQGARPDMLVPLAPLLDAVGVQFVKAAITSISDRSVGTSTYGKIEHDRLVFALGSHVRAPDIPKSPRSTFTVDTYADTQRLDQHLDTLAAGATIVVVGASFSGLEIATELRGRRGQDADIVLVDQADAAGQTLGETLAEPIAAALAREGVRYLGGETIARVSPHEVQLSSGKAIATETVILATGLQPSPLTSTLGPSEPDGRLKVDKTLKLPGTPTVFAAGDVAAAWADDAHQTLMSCQHAMPMGVIAGQNAVLDLMGAALKLYDQPDYATCLSLGSEAIFTQGWDRAVVLKGEAGAQMKTQINETWIYPPNPELGRDAIFDAILPLTS